MVRMFGLRNVCVTSPFPSLLTETLNPIPGSNSHTKGWHCKTFITANYLRKKLDRFTLSYFYFGLNVIHSGEFKPYTGQGRKRLIVANTLAYYTAVLITKVKKFMV
jgi:hypothetical protein